MKKKVVICTEEWAGSGHKMAALAIAEAVREMNTGIQVNIIYGLAAASPLLRQISHKAYHFSLTRAPRLWQRIYEREKHWKRMLHRPLAAVLGERLLRQVIEPEAPEVVIATHAYCLPALAWAKRRTSKPFQLGIAQTDFQLNSFWVNREIDYYIVSDEQIGDQLVQKFDVDPNRIYAYSIPIRPSYAEGSKRTKREWRKKLGLVPDLFTVLLCSGEAGHNDYVPVVQRLTELDVPLQIVVITGRNQRQLASLQQYSERGSTSMHRLHIKGYVEEMWQWLGAADVLVTKPGGLTCSEALAMGTPLILYRPLPGQEQRNSRFLQQKGVAYAAETPAEIASVLQRLAKERTAWSQAAAQAARLARPDSAYRTAEVILASLADDRATSGNHC
ncbi:glycosyltransferase [Brevibacillus humidisoli]|uniref:MGDG synthase family glycosyltransferase n=1 Tax=Brevibacillus humidisoli TaxID=2895522 RepID=UPI001E6142E6|nr:glycosyltransferase [Brevibacillus humidisoli]UFJ41618.1 glycosyltransferase [Brevibacillus humidisoli]